MHAARVSMMVCAGVMAVQAVSAAPVYSRYRGVSMGDSVSAAIASLHMTASDVAVVHARPAMIQQLTWRPNQFFTGGTGAPEALAEMVLTFHLGRLARVVATYDRDRTEGLTNTDLHDAFTTIYGTSMRGPDASRVRASSEPEITSASGVMARRSWSSCARGIRVASSSPCRPSPPTASCRMASLLACGSMRSRRRPGTWSVASARSRPGGRVTRSHVSTTDRCSSHDASRSVRHVAA